MSFLNASYGPERIGDAGGEVRRAGRLTGGEEEKRRSVGDVLGVVVVKGGGEVSVQRLCRWGGSRVVQLGRAGV